jgi:hypothetical protein
LTGCATTPPAPKETIPVVTVAPNSSDIQIKSTENHAQKNLIIPDGSPDIPSGVTISIELIHPPQYGKLHYSFPASGTLQVVNIEHPSAYNLDDTIRSWKSILDGEKVPDQEALKMLDSPLEEIPRINAARCLLAKVRCRTYPWGRAVLFLTCYENAISDEPVSNDILTLTVQGFTNDGRYAVNGRFEIHHPKLPGFWPLRARKIVQFDVEKQGKQAEAWLNGQPDDAFQPTFAQYETFLQSLQITPPLKK